MPCELWPLGLHMVHEAEQYQLGRRQECAATAAGLMLDIRAEVHARGVAVAALASSSPYLVVDPARLVARLEVVQERDGPSIFAPATKLRREGTSTNLRRGTFLGQLSSGVCTALQEACEAERLAVKLEGDGKIVCIWPASRA